MATFRRIVFTGLGWTFVCASAINVCAQNRTSNCFLIRIQLNGKSVEGPQSITLKTKIVKTVSLESGCFHLPQSLIAEKALDIYFTVPENKIYLSGIDPSFFNGTWDIELEDKKFPKSISLPKNARVQKACAVIFHIGEPEITISQTGCRSPAH